MSDIDQLPQVMREAIERRRARDAQLRDSMAEAHDNAIEASRYDVEQFEAAAGMSAAYFCLYVMRRRREGADFETMALELDDPRRSITFTAESVESIFSDLRIDLSIDNHYWLDEEPATPAIPPKDPIKPEPRVAEATSERPVVGDESDHPVGIPSIRLKSFDMSGSALAGRIAGHKAATRSAVPGIPLEDDQDEGLRLG